MSLRQATREELRQICDWEQDPDHTATVDIRPFVPRNYDDWLPVWDDFRSERVGFVAAGRLRQNVWSAGAYADEVLYGLLAPVWRAARG